MNVHDIHMDHFLAIDHQALDSYFHSKVMATKDVPDLNSVDIPNYFTNLHKVACTRILAYKGIRIYVNVSVQMKDYPEI